MEMTMMNITAYFATATIALKNVFQESTNIENSFTHIHTQSSGLLFPIKGSAWVHSGKEKFYVKPGKVFHFNNKEVLHIENCGDEHFEFIVTQYELSNRTNEDLYDAQFLLRLASEEIYLQKIYELLSLQAAPGAMAEMNRKNKFLSILQDVLEAARNEQLHATVDTMEQIVEYIQKHYNEKINVTKIAELYAIERRRLAYLFEKHTGLSPNTYITEYRVSKSKSLLERAELSIAEIAETVGYEDCFYYSRVFKKQTGMSPSAYRKQQTVSWTNS